MDPLSVSLSLIFEVHPGAAARLRQQAAHSWQSVLPQRSPLILEPAQGGADAAPGVFGVSTFHRITLLMGGKGPRAVRGCLARAQNGTISSNHITRARVTGIPNNHKIIAIMFLAPPVGF